MSCCCCCCGGCCCCCCCSLLDSGTDLLRLPPTVVSTATAAAEVTASTAAAEDVEDGLAAGVAALLPSPPPSLPSPPPPVSGAVAMRAQDLWTHAFLSLPGPPYRFWSRQFLHSLQSCVRSLLRHPWQEPHLSRFLRFPVTGSTCPGSTFSDLFGGLFLGFFLAGTVDLDEVDLSSGA